MLVFLSSSYNWGHFMQNQLSNGVRQQEKGVTTNGHGKPRQLLSGDRRRCHVIEVGSLQAVTP